MTKTLRASVCFPTALHTSIKIAVATANPRVTLTDFVSRIVESSSNVSDTNLLRARKGLIYDDRPIRSTVTLPYKVAALATNRAMTLGMGLSAFIAAVVAHKLNGNGK